MKLFTCQNCGQLLYFENTLCMRCGHKLGYVAERATLATLVAQGDAWQPLGEATNYRFCANAQNDICNWLVRADGREPFCTACRYNRTVPDLVQPGNLAKWRQLELAKHRLIYALIAFGLPRPNRVEDAHTGLAFDFLADSTSLYEAKPHVATGHDGGIITINVAEADDATRERVRTNLGEPYRTLLGHFRHEIGHWYWDLLVANGPAHGAFRELFGDESADYNASLKTHYQNGPANDWGDRFVTAYASSHPWEDFAESWAHYMHIVDALETANVFGVRVTPRVTTEPGLAARIDFNPYGAVDMERLIGAWLPLTFAVNSLNRSMGMPDLYPFVLSPAVMKKLGFIHDLIRSNKQQMLAA